MKLFKRCTTDALTLSPNSKPPSKGYATHQHQQHSHGYGSNSGTLHSGPGFKPFTTGVADNMEAREREEHEELQLCNKCERRLTPDVISALTLNHNTTVVRLREQADRMQEKVVAASGELMRKSQAADEAIEELEAERHAVMQLSHENKALKNKARVLQRMLDIVSRELGARSEAMGLGDLDDEQAWGTWTSCVDLNGLPEHSVRLCRTMLAQIRALACTQDMANEELETLQHKWEAAEQAHRQAEAQRREAELLAQARGEALASVTKFSKEADVEQELLHQALTKALQELDDTRRKSGCITYGSMDSSAAGGLAQQQQHYHVTAPPPSHCTAAPCVSTAGSGDLGVSPAAPGVRQQEGGAPSSSRGGGATSAVPSSGGLQDSLDSVPTAQQHAKPPQQQQQQASTEVERHTDPPHHQQQQGGIEVETHANPPQQQQGGGAEVQTHAVNGEGERGACNVRASFPLDDYYQSPAAAAAAERRAAMRVAVDQQQQQEQRHGDVAADGQRRAKIPPALALSPLGTSEPPSQASTPGSSTRSPEPPWRSQQPLMPPGQQGAAAAATSRPVVPRIALGGLAGGLGLNMQQQQQAPPLEQHRQPPPSWASGRSPQQRVAAGPGGRTAAAGAAAAGAAACGGGLYLPHGASRFSVENARFAQPTISSQEKMVRTPRNERRPMSARGPGGVHHHPVAGNLRSPPATARHHYPARGAVATGGTTDRRAKTPRAAAPPPLSPIRTRPVAGRPGAGRSTAAGGSTAGGGQPGSHRSVASSAAGARTGGSGGGRRSSGASSAATPRGAASAAGTPAGPSASTVDRVDELISDVWQTPSVARGPATVQQQQHYDQQQQQRRQHENVAPNKQLQQQQGVSVHALPAPASYEDALGGLSSSPHLLSPSPLPPAQDRGQGSRGGSKKASLSYLSPNKLARKLFRNTSKGMARQFTGRGGDVGGGGSGAQQVGTGDAYLSVNALYNDRGMTSSVTRDSRDSAEGGAAPPRAA